MPLTLGDQISCEGHLGSYLHWSISISRPNYGQVCYYFGEPYGKEELVRSKGDESEGKVANRGQ